SETNGSVGSPIANAINASYSPSTATEGTLYYYVVVTNTNNSVSGNKEANATSDTAKIEISALLPEGYHNVSFYDHQLDFIKTIHAEGTINPTELFGGIAVWYVAEASDWTTEHTLTGDIRFYNAPRVHEIFTEADLDNARNNLTHNYIMFNDIELTSATLGEDGGDGWNPIGYNYSHSFTGIFNGNGYAVRNLWINRPSTNYVGLFGSANVGARIRNLGVEIDNSKGGVKGKNYVGGIAGYVYGSSITDSYSTGDVSANSYIGAIAGYVYNNYSFSSSNSISITNSYSTGDVSGASGVGGIAGYVYNSSYSSSISITNSYSTGSISGTGNYVGGIAGYVYISSSYSSSISITNNYSTGNVSGASGVGGIAGYVYHSNTYASISITNSYSTGSVSGTSDVGGIAGYVTGSRSTIKNNAAINQEINGSANVNRIVGNISGGDVQNNFALDAMTTNGGGTFSNASDLAYHGTSKSDSDLKSQATYSSAINGNGNSGLGWRFGNNDANPWKIDAGKNNGYPYLYWQE
ncbi:MAG: hypothetical protein LBQ52_06420, partial [Helicobacteraceae bacterium]|nr:hypothetical protein [Helicobacteraceae bacterium]